MTTARNVARFRQQLKSLGFSYDWSREISTTDPEYYRCGDWVWETRITEPAEGWRGTGGGQLAAGVEVS